MQYLPWLLERYREFWTESLDRLGDYLRELRARRRDKDGGH